MANKAGIGCLGWVVAGVLLVSLVGKCMGDPSPTTTAASETAERLSVQDWKYIRAASANCRTEGSTSAASVDRLERNAFVGVLQVEKGWSYLDRSPDCWVRNDLLSDDRVSEPVPIRSFSSAGGGSSYRERPSRRSSAYYQNCSAARAAGAAPVYRGDPGYARRLDRDGDGVGCE